MLDDLAPGEVRAVDHDGRDLVAWRTVSGRLVLCDARCPHQWSDLAVEGRVVGEELVCLSHHWRFDADGHGSKVNVHGRRDAKGDLTVHPVEG